MSEVQAERSRLLNRQKKDRSELEKEVKKKKGAMRVAAVKLLEELEAAQLAELTQFDGGALTESGDQAVLAEKQPEKQTAEPVRRADKSAPLDVEWTDLSKKDLQEECARRALSRGGGREELVTRLVGWAAEMRTIGYVPEEPEEQRSSDEDSVSSENEDDDDDDLPDMDDLQKLEAEKQYKRECIVRKAILHLFEAKFHQGFPLADLSANLEKIKVMNFKVESLGYTTLHEFARKQPREAIFYDKGIQWLKPVHLRSDKRGGAARK